MCSTEPDEDSQLNWTSASDFCPGVGDEFENLEYANIDSAIDFSEGMRRT